MKSYNNVKNWRLSMKSKILESMGSSCQICGYDRCPQAFDFHHVNPDEKEYQISRLLSHPKKLETVLDELEKCILLCSNCHRELHSGLVSIPENYKKLDRSVFLNKKEMEKFDLCSCGTLKSVNLKYCSHYCSHKARRKADWDSIDLIDLVKNQKIPFTSLGKRFGISDNAVKKQYTKQLKNRQLQGLDSNQ